MNYKLTVALTALTLCALSACNKGDDNDSGNELSQRDKTYMDNTTFINLGEVDAGNIAKDRGSESAVVHYGNMLVEDHGEADSKLRAIAADKSYNLPDETDQKHKDMAAHLSMLSGRAFDSTFLHMMVVGHTDAITIQENEIEHGNDPAIRGYAAEMLPIIKHHRHVADSLARALFP